MIGGKRAQRKMKKNGKRVGRKMRNRRLNMKKRHQ